MSESEQEAYNAKLEVKKIEIAKKIKQIYTKMKDPKEKARVEAMTPQEQNQYFADKIEQQGMGSKKKKSKKRLLQEQFKTLKSSPFEHASLDIGYRLAHACIVNEELEGWF